MKLFDLAKSLCSRYPDASPDVERVMDALCDLTDAGAPPQVFANHRVGRILRCSQPKCLGRCMAEVFGCSSRQSKRALDRIAIELGIQEAPADFGPHSGKEGLQ